MSDLRVSFGTDGRIAFRIVSGGMALLATAQTVATARATAQRVLDLCQLHEDVRDYEKRLSREAREIFDRYLTDASRWRFLVDLYNNDHPGQWIT